MIRIAIFLLILVIPSLIRRDHRPVYIIWNVGQGQWVTLSDLNLCIHWDAGGEHAPLQALHRECGEKRNIFYFSHWDWDHISFVRNIPALFKNVCLGDLPSGITPSLRKRRLFQKLPFCSPGLLTTTERTNAIQVWTPQNPHQHANDESRVFSAHDLLIPGDSTKKMEQIWSAEFTKPIRFLILGHHGSRTSTSAKMLADHRNLRLAIASARKQRYGHPHPEVVKRLRSFGIGTISTEDWGTIRIEMNPFQ